MFMNVLIFGLGLHNGGFNAALYYARRNYKVIVTDIKAEKEFGDRINSLTALGVTLHLGGHLEEDFLWADIIIKNPAITPNNQFLTLNQHITTDIIELLSFLKGNKRCHIIGISGTKGKSSTTHMISHVLKESGALVFMGGNIGVSGFSLIEEIECCEGNTDFFVVLELSSWQIRDMAFYSVDVMFQATIITSLYPDHGDYYQDIASYYDEKLGLFSFASKNRYMSLQAKQALKDSIIAIPSGVNYIRVEDLIKAPLLPIGIDKEVIERAMFSYKGLSHRQEVVATINSIIWINDSSATIPEAMNYTLNTLDIPYILIFGGSDKKCNIEVSLIFIQKASHLILLDGSFTRSKIIPFLIEKSIMFSGPYFSMKEAVKEAYYCANKKEKPITVVLSPGAASFGPFVNSDERGNIFKECVLQLS